MANYKYLRVSSEQQDYTQQMQCIGEYFHRLGISEDIITDIVVEKVSGTVKHTERKLARLMERCLANDKIYISELSRLGRSMTDLFYIINYLCDKGVTVIQCKDGTIIENKSIGGKALLFALSLAAEIEVQNIRQRTKAGLDARKELKRQQGFWLSKTGNKCTHFGREKGCKASPEAIAATSAAQTDNAARWREKSIAYQVYKQKKRAGWSDVKILELFREMSEVDPANYLSRKGKPITASTLSRWNGYLRQEDYIVTTA